ncbi:MAG: transporter substrate-binding domain-containing protein [Alphaproteobacteria bacterium]|nr:transporter substrate-binding domain-containing protein [Alphaproteobacteria bacterium]MCB9984903.1 transporter substrate-binding domain-containing protein [Micavibrio sp.]
MQKLFLAVLLCLISLPSFAAETKESAYDRVTRTGTIRCGYFVWAPYFSVDMETGKKSGAYYDIIEQLGKVLNLKIEWSYEYTLGQQVEALRTGKVDALCADGSFTRSAMPYVTYSEPYMFLLGYVYGAKESPRARNFETLNNEKTRFTLIDGDGSAEYVQMYFPKAQLLSMPSTSDPSQLALNIVTGKADAMFNDPVTFAYYREEDRAKMVRVSDKPVAILPLNMSVAKGESDLLDMLNQGVDLMNDTGMLDKILDQYDPSGELLKRPQKRYR